MAKTAKPKITGWPQITGEIDFKGQFDDATARRERAYREANERWPLPLGEPVENLIPPFKHSGRPPKLTQEMIATINRLRGYWSLRRIARELGVCKATVLTALKGPLPVGAVDHTAPPPASL